MMSKLKSIWLIAGVFMLAACTNQSEKNESPMRPDSPVAEKADTVLKEHGQSRIDPYFWMRLTDDQKKSESPDNHTQKVLNYLSEENEYTKTVLSHTEDLQQNLYDEIVGRIKQTDESVPYFSNGFWYYTRFEEGAEYPIYCRKKDNLDSDEIILLNVNELAKGYDYYAASGLRVSPDNKILSFGEDTLSRRIYTIRFKNLETDEFYEDKIENTTGGGAWANDNKTLFYCWVC